jgi:hypothetical protein
MNHVKNALCILRENRRAYVSLNVVFYGVLVCGMLYSAADPAFQRHLLSSFDLGKGSLAFVQNAYSDGNIPLAMFWTFTGNLLLGTVGMITLPSLVVPFAGFLAGAHRMLMWGVLLSPTTHELQMKLIPHSLTMILEAQGYILAMLAVYLHGKSFLFPKSFGLGTHWQGYHAGIKLSCRLYVLVILALGVSAVWEAIDVIVIQPVLLPAP